MLQRAQSVRTGRGSNMAGRGGTRSVRGRGNLLDRAQSARLRSSVAGSTAGARAAGARASRRVQNNTTGEREASKTASEDSVVPSASANSQGVVDGGDSKVRTSIAEGRRVRQSVRGTSLGDRPGTRSTRVGRGRGNLLDRAQSVRVRSSAVGGMDSGRGVRANRSAQRTASGNDVLAESEHGTSGTNPRSSRIQGSRLSQR